MEKLDFAELHKEKLALIFENIDILNAMKESDTQLPPRFFKEITDDVIFDYKAKIGILNKNTKFVNKVCNKGTYQRFSPTAAGAETAASGRTEKTKERNAHLRFARRSPAPVTKRATHGRRQPPVCAGGLSITSPPRNV